VGKQRKQVCGSDRMVVERAGTLLLCASAISQSFFERWQNKKFLNLSPSFHL